MKMQFAAFFYILSNFLYQADILAGLMKNASEIKCMLATK
jgi:hypothetical protein